MNLDKEFIGLQKQIEKMSKMTTIAVALNHKKILDNLRKNLARLYEQYEIDGQLTFDEMVKYNRLQKLDKEVEQMINELYKDNTKLIRGHLTGIANETSLYTTEVIEGATQRRLKGIVKELDASKTINDEMAGLKWTERMGKHRADVIWDVQKEIKRGLSQGDTYGTMAKRLKKELEISATKSNVIVRTESHRVHAQAKVDSLDGIAKHGVKMTKKWISSKDERVRSQHSEMDGVEIPYEDDFELPDGSKGKAPGLIGQPQHDINCRCIITIDILSSKIEEHYEETIAYEPEITKDIKNIVENNGGKLEGLDYRIKSYKSYERKVNDEIREVKDVNKALGKIYDTIRYTSITGTDDLTEHYFSVVDDLEQKGYNISRVKNFWTMESSNYKGINVVLQAPNKQYFELQFHTPESFKLKDGKLHKLYEEWRVINDKASSKAIALSEEMTKLSARLVTPANINKIR